MSVSRILAVVSGGFFFLLIGEWARFGVVTNKAGEWSSGESLGATLFVLVLAFLLAFGGARQ